MFGTGSFEVLGVENPSVLAFLRKPATETGVTGAAGDVVEDVVLCVNNLCRFAQPAEIVLTPYAGHVPSCHEQIWASISWGRRQL